MREALKHHVLAFYFCFTKCPKDLFDLLHEYTMWDIDLPCTDVAAEVAPQEPLLLWLLRHHGAPTIYLGPILQDDSQRGARLACGSGGLLRSCLK